MKLRLKSGKIIPIKKDKQTKLWATLGSLNVKKVPLDWTVVELIVLLKMGRQKVRNYRLVSLASNTGKSMLLDINVIKDIVSVAWRNVMYSGKVNMVL